MGEVPIVELVFRGLTGLFSWFSGDTDRYWLISREGVKEMAATKKMLSERVNELTEALESIREELNAVLDSEEEEEEGEEESEEEDE